MTAYSEQSLACQKVGLVESLHCPLPVPGLCLPWLQQYQKKETVEEVSGEITHAPVIAVWEKPAFMCGNVEIDHWIMETWGMEMWCSILAYMEHIQQEYGNSVSWGRFANIRSLWLSTQESFQGQIDGLRDRSASSWHFSVGWEVFPLQHLSKQEGQHCFCKLPLQSRKQDIFLFWCKK